MRPTLYRISVVNPFSLNRELPEVRTADGDDKKYGGTSEP
jgi:hypothetical protein